VVAVFERASRVALVASVAAITSLQLLVHPDLTPALRWAGIAAFGLGLLLGSRPAGIGAAMWAAAGALAPALLRLATGREGPVLDLVWMAGLAGALLRATPRSTWNLPPLWRLLLGGWALAVSLAWPIVVARELNFDWHTMADEGAVNSWALLTAGRVVGWVLYMAQAQMLGLLWFDWLAGQFAGERGDGGQARVAFHALWASATVASLVALYQGSVDLGFLSTPFWANERRAAGTLLDANGYGMLAALAAPVAAMWLHARGRSTAAVVVFALNGVGLWMSGSRTALVCGLAGAAGLAAAGLLRERRSSRAPRVVAIAMAALLLVASLGIFGSTIGPLRRIAEVPLSRAGLSDLWNRGGYGTIAVQMIRDTPWTGVGPGMYHVIAPDYWRVGRSMTLAFDNAQNWWRHQAAELGALGAAPVLAWSALLVAGLAFAAPRTGREDAYVPRAQLLGLGLASLLGMPTQSPVVLLWFFALVAWWSASSKGPLADGRLPARAAPAVALILTAMVLLHAAGTAVLARGWLRVPERATRTQREYVQGAYAPEPLAGSTLFRWTGRVAHFSWTGPTRWLMVRLWVQHPDAASSPVRVTLSTRCQTLVDEEFRSSAPVSIGIELPEGSGTLQATMESSRTWQPAPEGSGDSRQLGAAIVAEFLHSPEAVRMQNRFVQAQNCPS